MTDIDRRSVLTASIVTAAAAIGGLAPTGAAAQAAPVAQVPGFYRYKIGGYTITALHDGFANRPLDASFVRNAPFEEVKKAMADAFLPTETLPIVFTQLLVDTGSRKILLDTGTAGLAGPTSGQMFANLQAAGVDTAAVDTVIISHFHADHINGLKTKDNALAFKNAEVLVPQPEWAYWMDDGQMSRAAEGLQGGFRNVRRVFGDIGERVKRYDWGKEIAPGITAIEAPGHTPGHTAFTIASGNASLLVLSDITNHPALFVRNPDWAVVFDMAADTARASRHKLLDRAAADRMRIAGYHFPFPATGHVLKDGARFQFVPSQWSPQV